MSDAPCFHKETDQTLWEDAVTVGGSPTNNRWRSSIGRAARRQSIGTRVELGYLYVYQPEHPRAKKHNGYVAEHILVMEEVIGRSLLDDEVIHHKDKDRTNNDPDNLMVVTRAEHVRLHQLGTARKVTLVCAYCGEEFERLAHQVVTKLRRGQSDFYCNRSCMSKHFGRGRNKCAPLTQLEE